MSKFYSFLIERTVKTSGHNHPNGVGVLADAPVGRPPKDEVTPRDSRRCAPKLADAEERLGRLNAAIEGGIVDPSDETSRNASPP
ncbi:MULTISPECIES: hypothetical protein [Bradyrhizobium]|uniref:hypothetical protein n=1 Tax=Bradyrhizobium TaxID=374 RepID=UPI000943EC7E|nr:MULTISPECIES: hypothetical protein [Bradyrhizobium]